MSTNNHYDVIVIGGGASGMMAAGRAAERGKRVLLVEKNKDLGKKLSITGGGRCNILNAETDSRLLLENYGDAAKFLHSPLSQHGMQDSWNFFESRGLPLVVEARKRAFPETQSAPDVTRVMRTYVTSNNVELKLKTRAEGLTATAGHITGLQTSAGTYTADAYILASGGASHVETGSAGEGFAWLQKLGYTIHESSPNIVPLVSPDEWVTSLSGTTLSFMKITFGTDRLRATATTPGRFSKTGKILFTHFGLSGPLILNASHEVRQLLNKFGEVKTSIDMYPDTEIGTLRNRVLELFQINKNKTLKNILKEIVPAGMSEAVASLLPAGLSETKVHSVSRDDRHKLVDVLKNMPLTVTDTMGMDWAVISDGGVDLKDIDTKTMRSKHHNNLYFTGDVLHINRPSGGFSLQLCWTTGWVAGSHV